MNDLDLVADLRPDVRLPGPDELAPARGQLAAAMAAESGQPAADPHDGNPARPASPPTRLRPRRLVLAGVAATAVAAGVAAALVVVPGHGAQSGTNPPAASGHGKPPATQPLTQPLTGHLTAARFLHAAAHAALQRAATPPRPDQWVYSETESPSGAKTQIWLSADGSKGPLEEPSVGAIPPCTIAEAESSGCLPQVGYLPGMPTDPDKLFAYLDKVQIARDTEPPNSVPANWLANNLGKAVSSLMQQTYFLPAQQAALYNLMAKTPGFRIVPHAKDAVGRIGVGVQWVFETGKAEVILDPATYAYLGVRTWPAAGFTGPGAHQYDGDALIKLAVVDSPPANVHSSVKPHPAVTGQP